MLRARESIGRFVRPRPPQHNSSSFIDKSLRRDNHNLLLTTVRKIGQGFRKKPRVRASFEGEDHYVETIKNSLSLAVSSEGIWPGARPAAPATAEPAPNSDRHLAGLAAAGDMAAFEELYRRHNRRVYSVCFRMLANAAEAEDLTQEVFIHLFRKIGSFRGDSAFTTWLHRLTVNQVLMHFRRRKARPEKITEDGETPVQIVSGTENPDRMPVVNRIALDQAIAELAPGYRTVFVLHDVEGYEHEEIAKILKVSVGTSKSQLHKARLKLRKLLTATASTAATT